jgi:predicted  nucleic acid-binding Zn-ribbon protein
VSDKTEIEVVAGAIAGSPSPEIAAIQAIAALDAHRSAALPEEVRGLVGELRDLAAVLERGELNHWAVDAVEAADALEALSAELAREREIAESVAQQVADLDGVIAGLEAELAEARSLLRKLSEAVIRAANDLTMCPSMERGAGGMTITAQMGRTVHHNVPATLLAEAEELIESEVAAALSKAAEHTADN